MALRSVNILQKMILIVIVHALRFGYIRRHWNHRRIFHKEQNNNGYLYRI